MLSNQLPGPEISCHPLPTQSCIPTPGQEQDSVMDSGINIDHVSLSLDKLPKVEGPLFSLDIGGSLAKVAYLESRSKNDGSGNTNIHLVSFPVQSLDDCLSFIKSRVMGSHTPRQPFTVQCTGVGCLKYRHRIEEHLQIRLQGDTAELDHALKGIDFLWRHLPRDSLLYERSDTDSLNFQCPLAESGFTPGLVVSLGSALVICKVEADGSSGGIIGGSSQGGLTFLGLGSLLTQTEDFNELVELAAKGNRKKCDLLIQDTAGQAYNVPQNYLVSSFGKVTRKNSDQSAGEILKEDIASSLLYLITDQMAQTAFLMAKCHQVNNIIFCGSYLTHNPSIIPQIKEKLAAASYFLQTDFKAAFIKHEGYIGALGLLASQYYSHLNHNNK